MLMLTIAYTMPSTLKRPYRSRGDSGHKPYYQSHFTTYPSIAVESAVEYTWRYALWVSPSLLILYISVLGTA